MYNRRIIIEVILAVLVLAGLICLVRWYSPNIPKALQIQGHTIVLEIADSADERRRGLSGRANLDADTGMLFVFRQPGYYSFWMPDMYFPIDIIWIDKHFFVVDIEKNVLPESYPKIFQPSREAQYVLELNAGKADEFGIRGGSILTPVF